MWERICYPARCAIVNAINEACRFRHPFVDPWHLAFGCLTVHAQAYDAVHSIMGDTSVLDLEWLDLAPLDRSLTGNEPTLSPEGKTVIDIAYGLSRTWPKTQRSLLDKLTGKNKPCITTGMILLGCIGVDSRISSLLASKGITIEQLEPIFVQAKLEGMSQDNCIYLQNPFLVNIEAKKQ